MARSVRVCRKRSRYRLSRSSATPQAQPTSLATGKCRINTPQPNRLATRPSRPFRPDASLRTISPGFGEAGAVTIVSFDQHRDDRQQYGCQLRGTCYRRSKAEPGLGIAVVKVSKLNTDGAEIASASINADLPRDDAGPRHWQRHRRNRPGPRPGCVPPRRSAPAR